MKEVEQGWSHGWNRQLWRFLARNVPSGRRPLRGQRAVASITFDDVPESAATVGASILDKHDVRGTFYVAAGLCGQQDRYWRVASREQIGELSAARHEIGCHTARHVNVQSLRARDLMRECDVNYLRLAEICGRTPRNFCYPFGDVGLIQKRVLATRFDTCRTIYERLNVGSVDPAMLSAFGLFDSVLDRQWLSLLARWTIAECGWLILYTHDVAAEPTPMGVTPRLLGEAIQVFADQGLPVLTVEDAARYHGFVRGD